jgi:hypothetical protein
MPKVASHPWVNRDCVGKLLLAGWLVITLVGLAALSLKHMASLPIPHDQALLERATLQLRHHSGEKLLVHVISGECSCARALFAHLVSRRPFPGAEEIILFVGPDTRKQDKLARLAGFAFTTVSAQELGSRFGLEAAPVLIVMSSAGELQYVGGYYAHPATTIPLDERIYTQLAAGTEPQPLPVFGCAVSPRLQQSLTLLHLQR